MINNQLILCSLLSRIHPYAANSSRNQPQGYQGASRNQVLQVAATCVPANRADEEEGASLTVGKYNGEMNNLKTVKIFYEILIIYAFFLQCRL